MPLRNDRDKTRHSNVLRQISFPISYNQNEMSLNANIFILLLAVAYTPNGVFLSIDQFQPPGFVDRFDAVVGVQLDVDVLEMGVHGGGADEQRGGDLAA